MDDKQLQQLVAKLSIDYFKKPFIDVACFNSRLRTTGGRYLPKQRKIEINRKYLTELGIEELIGIIKHELCHYHLHIEGRPFGHRNQEFKALLKETNSPRHCRPLPSEQRDISNVHQYECIRCGQLYKRKRRVNINQYTCGRCKGKIKLVQ